MRSWLMLILVSLSVNLLAVRCPSQDILTEINFTVPTEINWYQFAFIKIPGSDYSLDVEDSEQTLEFSATALYAPVDVGNNDLDLAYKKKITTDANTAKMHVSIKTIDIVDGECFYQAQNYMHIMFLLKLKSDSLS